MFVSVLVGVDVSVRMGGCRRVYVCCVFLLARAFAIAVQYITAIDENRATTADFQFLLQKEPVSVLVLP